MKKKILPSAVEGSLQAPPSKSVAQRAIAMASLAETESEIIRPGTSSDVGAAVKVCRALGADIREQGQSLLIKGRVGVPKNILHCGESGLAVRMFAGIAATLNREITLTGTGSLLKRPMHMVRHSLSALGVSCTTNRDRLPLVVKGPIKRGHAIIDASQSSQVLTGILIGAPMSGAETLLQVKNLKSKAYVDLTLEIMHVFGVEVSQQKDHQYHVRGTQQYRGCKFKVEGDWSAAAFLLVAGAIAGQSRVTGLNMASLQADRKILEALSMAGADISQEDDSAGVRKKKLKAFGFDATGCPDLFPPLVALAANCRGTSRIRGTERLGIKESDRTQSLIDIFSRMGTQIRQEGNDLLVTGGVLRSATVDSHNDHRIAMAAAVAALNATGPVNILGAEVVDKSYPGFYEDLQKISKP